MAIERIERKPETTPIQEAYRAEHGRWHARVEVLVTALCMGRTGRGESIYAFEVSALPPHPGDQAEERFTLDAFGRPVPWQIIPAWHRHGEDKREQIGRLADDARAELVEQVNQIHGRALTAERWSTVADLVMQTPALIAWLVSQRLLPKPPVDPLRAERARRSGISEAERQANAEALAGSLRGA